MSFGFSDEEPADTGLSPDAAAEEPVEITDPRALRALAHPARLAILERLILDGPATATECAEVAGLSPSACSYHLRALARHGFVEEDPAGGTDGRHRPWRARFVAMKVNTQPGRPEALRAASRVLLEHAQARFDEVKARYLEHESEYPADWQEAAGFGQEVLHVTAAELTQIEDQIRGLLAGYRRFGSQERPEGARRVQVLLDFTPWFAPDRPA
jgi:DNA-binding transcriptional ArsR family regulator